MNLLPGLRDLRAPLAAGYLWLTAGWLYFAPQLPASVDEADGVLKDIYHVIEASGPVAAAAGLSFAAYIIGILSTGLLTVPIGILIKRILPEVVYFLLKVPAYIIASLGVFWNHAPTKAEQYEDGLVEWYNSMSRSTGSRARTLVAQKISTRIVHDPQLRDLVLSRLRPTIPEQLKIVEFRNRSGYVPFRDLILSVRDLFSNQLWPETPRIQKIEEFRNRWEGLSLGSRLPYMNHVRFDLSDPDRETKITNQLSDLIEESDFPAIESIVDSTIDVDLHAQDVVSELQLVPERLVGDKPATYERWDRLNAEGEFREAVVPPLVAIIIVLFSRGALTWPSGLLLLIPAVVILIQGMIRLAEANGQLIQTLEADVISSTSLKRLATMDLYWLRSTVHHERDSQVSEELVSENEALEAKQGKPEVEAFWRQVDTTKPGGHVERKDELPRFPQPAD